MLYNFRKAHKYEPLHKQTANWGYLIQDNLNTDVISSKSEIDMWYVKPKLCGLYNLSRSKYTKID